MLTAQSAQNIARVAGVAYLVIFALAIPANFFVFEPLGIEGDIAATAANIAANEAVYRAGVAAFMAILIADLIVGWALFVVLRPIDKALALLAILFRGAYTIAHIGVVLGLISALSLATTPSFSAHSSTQALAYHFLMSHGVGFTVTLIFFGVHLVLIGTLIARASYIPRAIGWLLMIAGIAYAADGFGKILLGSYGPYAEAAVTAVIIPTLIGEGALMLWLLVWGVDKTRFDHALASRERRAD